MTTTSTQPGLTFDAGEIILRVPEAISPVSLRNSDIGKQFIYQNVTWYDSLPWANEEIPSGVYRLRLPIPDSNNKTFAEQKTLLLDGEDVAPLVLVALAMLCLKKADLPNPLQGGWVRCRETTAAGSRVVLAWNDGRLCVVSNCWDDGRYGHVWLAAVRGTS